MRAIYLFPIFLIGCNLSKSGSSTRCTAASLLKDRIDISRCGKAGTGCMKQTRGVLLQYDAWFGKDEEEVFLARDGKTIKLKYEASETATTLDGGGTCQGTVNVLKFKGDGANMFITVSEKEVTYQAGEYPLPVSKVEYGPVRFTLDSVEYGLEFSEEGKRAAVTASEKWDLEIKEAGSYSENVEKGEGETLSCNSYAGGGRDLTVCYGKDGKYRLDSISFAPSPR